jgi:cytochrome c553
MFPMRCKTSLLAALLIGAASLSSATGAQAADESSLLPDGAGKGLVLGSCTQCHNLKSTAYQRKSAAEWQHSVRDMVSRGAQVPEEVISLISDYLVRSFGPDVPPVTKDQGPADEVRPGVQMSGAGTASGTPPELPDGPAKTQVVEACTSCHGLDRITIRGKDEDGWYANVNDMVRLGTRLSPEQIIPVVEYLSEHFGRDATSLVSARPRPAGDADQPQLWIVGSLERLRKTPVPETGRLSDLLPDREGKGLIVGTCVQCHGLRYTVQQRKVAAEWSATVNDMVARGAQISEDETDLITSYLAENLSPESD